MRPLLLCLVLSAAVANAARADCRQIIQDLLAAGETWENYSLKTEVRMDGKAVQHTEQFFADYSHFHQVVEETGVHWLVLGDQEFTSRDGVTWQASQTRPENWLEETKARNAALRDSISSPECGNETVDGKELIRLSHVQETTAPVASVSDVVTWLDPATMRPKIRKMTTTLHTTSGDQRRTPAEDTGPQIETVTVYSWDEAIALPTP